MGELVYGKGVGENKVAVHTHANTRCHLQERFTASSFSSATAFFSASVILGLNRSGVNGGIARA